MNNKDIGNTLNEHYCTIGEKLASKYTTNNMVWYLSAKTATNLDPR